MKRLLAALLAAALLCGCTGRNAPSGSQATIFCMDTVMDMQFWGADSETATEQVSRMLSNLEEKWSAVSETSLLSSLDTPGTVLSDQDQALLDRAMALSRRTGGAFDPRLYNLTALWGFPSGNYRVPTQAQIREALAKPRWDLGGALKGYAGDQAVALLSNLQITCALLNLGGNVQTYGTKVDGSPWRVAIQDPRDPEGQAGILTVEGTVSIVTSGGYQRYFTDDNGVRYHHILDPETGYPAETGLASVTILCADGMTADALSTALFVMGLERAAVFWRESDDFEAVFLLESGEIYATEGVNLSGCDFEVIRREK